MSKSRNHRKYVTGMVASLVIALISTGIAYASFISNINTTDGAIDSNWPTTAIIPDANDVANDNYDILNFWWGTDANPPTVFYFRAELVGTLPTDGSWLEAQLSCDNDEDFFEAVDVLVEWFPSSDTGSILNGTASYSDPLGAAWGEAIATHNYEWKVPTSASVWNTCKAATNIRVRLETYDSFVVAQDTTASRGYHVPTAVTLQRLDGTATHQNGIAVALSVGLVLVGLVVAYSIWHKRKHNLSV